MKLLAIFPTLLALAAIILTLLCIFAGSKPGFMESYSIIALNTSRIGQNLVNQAAQAASGSNSKPSGFFSSWLKNATKPLADKLQNLVSEATNSLAKEFGTQDFYSAHLLNYCEGGFTPGPMPNATLKVSDIKRNVTYCSNRTSFFEFDPKAALQRSLNKTKTGITLDDLGWPKEIDDGIHDLKTAINVTFALYCVGAGFAFFAFLVALWWFLGRDARRVKLAEVVLAGISFLALLISSAIVTVVASKGDNLIDKYGAKIGVEAARGNGYLGLTWAATGSIFLVLLIGAVGLFGSRKQKVKQYAEK